MGGLRPGAPGYAKPNFPKPVTEFSESLFQCGAIQVNVPCISRGVEPEQRRLQPTASARLIGQIAKMTFGKLCSRRAAST